MVTEVSAEQFWNAYFLKETEIYQQYHMKNPTVFYNKEDVWSIANEIYGSDTQQMEPYYVNMRLPGSDELEYLGEEAFKEKLRKTLVHEVRHHNEYLAGYRDLEVYDEQKLRAYYESKSKKNRKD